MVQHALESSYIVDVAASLQRGEELIGTNSYDLIILDLNLPDGSGFDFFRKHQSNSRFTETPIIILSAKTEVPEKVMGFYLGIDDYVEKPFNPFELKARIDARIRKKQFQKIKSNVYKINNCEFSLDKQALFIVSDGDKELLDLTPIEFRLLLTLAQSPEKVFSRDDLIETVWHDSPSMVARGVDTHISHLRKKLGTRSYLIQSSYGEGYYFNAKYLEGKQ